MGCCMSADPGQDKPLPTKKSSLRSLESKASRQVDDQQQQPQLRESPLKSHQVPNGQQSSSSKTKKKIKAIPEEKGKSAVKQNVYEIQSKRTMHANHVDEKRNKEKETSELTTKPSDVKPLDHQQSAKRLTLTNLEVGPDIFVSLKKGHINDQYKIGKTLGEGAYGKVYQVQHRTTGIIRAMKAIKKKAVIKEEEEKLFAEVSILKGLDHPNIVKLYELYQDDNNYYLITEYCTGGELFDKIQQMHSFSEKLAAEYMRQILSAVVYCHSKQIVHRDLKPENLLLDSTKSNASLKVIDFGTSKKFQDGKKMTQKYGTAYYIAPEVLDRNYDEKCDVWSCGVILYILLCGYPPFGGASDNEILQKVKKAKFRFDEEDWSKISEDAKDLIRKMLVKDPSERISAAEALKHPWMTKNAAVNPLNTKAINNLTQFRSKNKLRQAILAFIATQMTSPQEREELQATFSQLDEDGNGVLSKEELVKGYKLVYPDKADVEIEVQNILEQVDINKSGQLDFTEFIIAATKYEQLVSQQKLSQAFRIFDIDGDGYITRDELENVMGGIELDEDAWKELVDECDENKDGKISQDEFRNLLLKMQ